MASIFTRAFWAAASERAVKTGAQAVLTTYLVGDVALNALDADWANMGGVALGGLVLSYLTSIASGVGNGSPSAGNLETPTPQVAIRRDPATGRFVAAKSHPAATGKPVLLPPDVDGKDHV